MTSLDPRVRHEVAQRSGVPFDLAGLLEPAPAPSRADWNDEGVVILPEFVPGDLIDAYCSEWLDNHAPTARWQGWPHATPYMQHPALRAICTEPVLASLLEGLIGEPAGVHLNLTGWVSTERNWHQDSYLNPAHVGDSYAAIWIALADIHPDSGPFQYVPGSHRWPQVTQTRIAGHLDLTDPEWPKHSEALLVPLFEEMIATRQAEPVTYVPCRGDLLVWHGRLLHRGSVAKRRGMERRALIAHYSGINHRPDMPPARRADDGGWYFPIDTRHPVNPPGYSR